MNFRHGDINFIKSQISIDGLKKLGDREFILAEGETTNHFHTIKAVEKSTVNVYSLPNGDMVVQVDGTAVLTHPEHKTLTFPTGTWEVKREREYDYFTKSTRRVID